LSKTKWHRGKHDSGDHSKKDQIKTRAHSQHSQQKPAASGESKEHCHEWTIFDLCRIENVDNQTTILMSDYRCMDDMLYKTIHKSMGENG